MPETAQTDSYVCLAPSKLMELDAALVGSELFSSEPEFVTKLSKERIRSRKHSN